MITLSVVKIRVPDEKYLLTRHELDQVRDLLSGIDSDKAKEADSRLSELLKDTHTFESGKTYTLFVDTLKLEETFYVWSTRKVLTQNESTHISKLINCAITAPNSLLVFPEYIMISSEPPGQIEPAPKAKKPPRKKKGKKDGDA